ncbi:tyrosine-type recombinase/integrase [Metapseudomonas otitidis]|uniref:tyrosine-type recombinase/integrase n=1 Tax=Metapseudomonas otitidis TaxID=319939 RepID=UPI00366FB7A2
MGRRPTNPGSVSRLRKRVRGKLIYYSYDLGGKPRKEMYLGKDYGLAILEYAKLEQSRAASEKVKEVLTFRFVAEKYLVEVVPTKSPATQKDNLRELKQLLGFFEEAPLEDIEPQHVRQYMHQRGKAAPVRANREKALLSAIWNYARSVGYTKLANPCAGIKGHKESGRDVYVEDDVYAKVYDAADQPLRDAMDLAYLAGQRVSDTLKMDEARDIRSGFLHVTQAKTSAKRRIEIVGQLKELLDRIRARKSGYAIHSTRLIVMEDGQPMSYSMLRSRFDKARELAGVAKKDFQMRDLRAKAGTDKADSSGDIRQAQKQLGHTSVVMTEAYVRSRRGDKTTPTK